MKTKKCVVAFLIVVFLLTGLTVTANGADITLISVTMGINLKVDGEYYQPTDAGGNAVQVFNFDGTVYLPVRAIANTVGATIDWEQSTKTVSITDIGTLQNINKTIFINSTYTKKISVSKGVKIHIDDVLLTSSNGDAAVAFNYNGTVYVPIRAVAEGFGLNVTWDQSTETVVLRHETDYISQAKADYAALESLYPKLKDNYDYLWSMKKKFTKMFNKVSYLWGESITKEEENLIDTVCDYSSYFSTEIEHVIPEHYVTSAETFLNTYNPNTATDYTTAYAAKLMLYTSEVVYNTSQELRKEIEAVNPEQLQAQVDALYDKYN